MCVVSWSLLLCNSSRGGQEIEESCNAAVREGHAVSFVMSDEFDWPENAPRGLPSKPPAGAPALRLVKIGDLDVNPCGGTHLRSTAELQARATT